MTARRAGCRLVVDGQDLSAKINAGSATGSRLSELSLTEKRGKEADELTIRLSDHDGKLAIPPKGRTISLALGWLAGGDVTIGLVEKGTFVVDESGYEGPPDIVTITGRSADLIGPFRIRRTASYNSTTIGAVLRTIAARHGWQPAIDPTLAAIAVPVIAQDHKSDMALLRRLGHDYDAVATVKAGKLLFNPIGKGATAGGRVFAGATIARLGGVARYSYRGVDRDQEGGCEAEWYDQDGGERKVVRGTHRDASVQPKRLRRVYNSHADATAAVEAERARTQRAEFELELDLAIGRPDLFPERQISLTGFKAEIMAHTWLTKEVGHYLDSRGGLTTKLQLETPGLAVEQQNR